MKKTLLTLLLLTSCAAFAAAPPTFVLPTSAKGTNIQLTTPSITGGTNTGQLITGATITGSLTGTNSVLTTPSITGGTNTGQLITGATITGSLTGTNAVLTTPSITGGTNTGQLITGATITGSLTGTNAVLTTPAITGGTNTSSLFLNSTLTGFTASLQTNTDLTASKVLVSDSAQRITNSTVSTTTLGYLDATSSIQTQLNSKTSATNGTFTGGTFTGATNVNPVMSGTVSGGTYSAAENVGMLNGTNTFTGTNTFNTKTDFAAGLRTTIIHPSSDSTSSLVFARANGSTYLQSFDTSNSRIGWGTTTPSFTWDFSGVGASGFRIVDSSTASLILDNSTPNTGNRWYIQSRASGELRYTNTGTNGAGPSTTPLWITGSGLGVLTGANPQYPLDINGQARIIGTNGMRFGGTSGAADDTVRISQSSANNLLLTATSTTVSGTLTPTGRLIVPMGEISYFNTTGTLITIGGTSDGSSNMQVVNPATALSSGVHEFDNGGGNTGRLRFTGATTRMHHVAVTVSGTPSTPSDVFVLGLAKNGTVVAASKVLGSTSGTQFSALNAMVELASNDYIELYIGNVSGTRNFTVKSLNIFSLGN